MSAGWSDDEVRLIVEDYLEMLGAELTGERFNKTEHRKASGKAPTLGMT